MASAADLAGIPLFESLSDSDLRELASWFEQMFGSDFRLLQEAQPGIAARIEEAMSQRLSINT